MSRTWGPELTVPARLLGAAGAVGAGCTVMAAAPLTPSLVARITVVPSATPVTSPDGPTSATVGSTLDQVMLRPVSGFPAESRGSAESCAVEPSKIVTVPGDTAIDATGTSVTVTSDVSASVPLLSAAMVT